MSIELSANASICFKCGTEYPKSRANFPTSYGKSHKGVGHTPICRTCINDMYAEYFADCNDDKLTVRQMCRKLDIYWNEKIYDMVERKNTGKTMIIQYIAKLNSVTYAGKSYDDTLKEEGTLWKFASNGITVTEHTQSVETEDEDVDDEIKKFWGPGYTSVMYRELEERKAFWYSEYPNNGADLDSGTKALIRQICSMEIDINRDRAAGRSVDKSVNTLNTLLGSANLKPSQSASDEIEDERLTKPLGVWLDIYEHKRPLPETEKSLRDVNGVRKYVFIWVLGHLCKMLGIKNSYSQLYEEEVERLRVEKPEYEGDDDESFIYDVMLDGSSKDSDE